MSVSSPPFPFPTLSQHFFEAHFSHGVRHGKCDCQILSSSERKLEAVMMSVGVRPFLNFSFLILTTNCIANDAVASTHFPGSSEVRVALCLRACACARAQVPVMLRTLLAVNLSSPSAGTGSLYTIVHFHAMWVIRGVFGISPPLQGEDGRLPDPCKHLHLFISSSSSDLVLPLSHCLQCRPISLSPPSVPPLSPLPPYPFAMCFPSVQIDAIPSTPAPRGCLHSALRYAVFFLVLFHWNCFQTKVPSKLNIIFCWNLCQSATGLVGSIGRFCTHSPHQPRPTEEYGTQAAELSPQKKQVKHPAATKVAFIQKKWLLCQAWKSGWKQHWGEMVENKCACECCLLWTGALQRPHLLKAPETHGFLDCERLSTWNSSWSVDCSSTVRWGRSDWGGRWHLWPAQTTQHVAFRLQPFWKSLDFDGTVNFWNCGMNFSTTSYDFNAAIENQPHAPANSYFWPRIPLAHWSQCSL